MKSMNTGGYGMLLSAYHTLKPGGRLLVLYTFFFLVLFAVQYGKKQFHEKCKKPFIREKSCKLYVEK